MAYTNIDIISVKTFGKQSPISDSWADNLTAANKDFSKVDASAVAESLAHNVDESYSRLTEFKAKDLDTEYEYNVFFDNQLKMWNVEFKNNREDLNVDILPN